MLCPLCQASYRDGFIECSDCHIDLVATSQEAQDSAVRLWEGEKQGILDSVLDVLSAQSIPTHYKETAKVAPGGRLILLGGLVRTKFHYEVWVLRKDLTRARIAIGDVSPLDELFCPLCKESYREALTQCSKCNVGLVGSLQDAEQAAVRLWDGTDESILEPVLDALADRNIPSHFKETESGSAGWKVEVWVLVKDLPSARAAVTGLVREPPDSI